MVWLLSRFIDLPFHTYLFGLGRVHRRWISRDTHMRSLVLFTLYIVWVSSRRLNSSIEQASVYEQQSFSYLDEPNDRNYPNVRRSNHIFQPNLSRSIIIVPIKAKEEEQNAFARIVFNFTALAICLLVITGSLGTVGGFNQWFGCVFHSQVEPLLRWR